MPVYFGGSRHPQNIDPAQVAAVIKLQSIPAAAIICHYAVLPSGKWAVITPSHKVLAPSFYELRHLYNFHMSINGAGSWVVLAPKQTATQPALF